MFTWRTVGFLFRGRPVVPLSMLTPMSSLRRSAALLALLLVSAVAQAAPERTLDDYRHFRALNIDLLGHLPTRAELTAFERNDFKWESYIDRALAGPGLVDRLTRIYMDALRLEVGPAFNYAPPPTTLHRVTILGPTGRPEYVYFRATQRRGRVEADGRFCMSAGPRPASSSCPIASSKASRTT